MIATEAPKTGFELAEEVAVEGSAPVDPLLGKPNPPNSPKPQTFSLLRAGAWTLLGYCVFWVLMQSQTLWARPIAMPGSDAGLFEQIRRHFPQGWLQASAASWLGFANALLYILLLLLLFGVYCRTLRSAFRPIALRAIIDSRALWFVLGVTGAILLVLLIVPGTMSADLHSYIWYGRIFHHYGANPFLHAPADFAALDAGRWLDLVYWKEVPSVYGPVWVWLAGGVAWLAGLFGGDISSHLLGHKLLAAAAHMFNVFLMWHVAEQVIARYWRKPSFASALGDEDWQQGSRLGATLFYAWNPLLLIEFGANGHNDVLLLTCMLGGLWLYLLGRWRLAAIAFALACMVKAAALLWWPGFLWILFWRTDIGGKSTWRGMDGVGRIAQAVGIAFATWVLCYLPFWNGAQTLQPLTDGPTSRLFVNSLAAMVRYNGGEWLRQLGLAQGWPDLAGQTADYTRVLVEGWIRWFAWGVTFVLAAPYIWRGRNLPELLKGWSWLLFFYLTVGAVWFWPWYVAWLVVPVALVGPGRLMTATLILCLTSLSLYAIYPKLPAPISELLYWRALITVAPALIYVWIQSIRFSEK